MGSFIKELWAFLRVRKKLWLAPIIIVMVLLGGLYGDEEETPRQFLEKGDLIIVLQYGLDAMLQACATEGNPGTFNQDPNIFLAQWLKRNNPARNEAMRELIKRHRAGDRPDTKIVDGLVQLVADAPTH